MKSFVFAVLIAGTLLFGYGGFIPLTDSTSVSAQEVPVMGPNGWEIPQDDDESAYYTGITPSVASSSQGYSTGYSDPVEQWRPIVEKACQQYGCNTEQLLRVIRCESGGDPGAVGPNGELGILQVDPYYWGEMTSEQQIDFAASDFADGYGNYWVCQGW